MEKETVNKNEIAIRVEGVEKAYKLYERRSDRLKDAFGLLKGDKSPKVNYALHGVDMEIHKGETVGIIGTNGSGKSTLLKIITGVLSPTAGSVTVEGRISALLELGAGFNMEYNGIENIYLNGTMIGFSKQEIDEKLPAILDFAEIGDYVYQPVKTYSSGMFVRLAFAVAINIDPEILIVDEALSVGDVFFQSKCYKKFDEFKAQGKTILFVSHDLSSISKYCDRAYLLNKGDMLASGSPKEMIDAYKQVLAGQFAVDFKKQEAEKSAAEEGRNEDTLEYGSGSARIMEMYMLDENGVKTNAVIKGSTMTMVMKVAFMEDVPAPIFAFTIKNPKGVEITGTNTMFEKTYLEGAKKGEVKEISFRQPIDLQGGNYLISLGVTGYRGYQFEVYHRLYDVLSLTVVSSKDTVGFYDCNSVIEVKDVK